MKCERSKWTAKRGQSLVETALALPGLAFVVWILAQLVFFCFNAVEHQRMAHGEADHASLANYAARGLYGRGHRFLGQRGWRTPRPLIHRRILPTPEKREFRGLSDVQTGGHLVEVAVESDLATGAFMGRVLRNPTQRAAAEVWLEPPVPEGL